ncbi:hypothetical protein MNBD_ALPHA11-2177 [hydrothermal vent metagenome]|uniref:Uncharacterized protein n=1 Tax=hydrothermal vent metagenome TaxID=652676 RepID=A0A3B0UES1_9ZZZZ
MFTPHAGGLVYASRRRACLRLTPAGWYKFTGFLQNIAHKNCLNAPTPLLPLLNLIQNSLLKQNSSNSPLKEPLSIKTNKSKQQKS